MIDIGDINDEMEEFDKKWLMQLGPKRTPQPVEEEEDSDDEEEVEEEGEDE